jgi:hypothetical protein
MRGKIKNLLEIIKGLLADNYKVLSFIIVFYFSLALIWQILFKEFPFSRYENSGVIVFQWLILVYSIWSVVKLFKEDSKSSWILFFIFLGLFYNPIKQMDLWHDEIYGVIFVVSWLLILIYNRELVKSICKFLARFFVALFDKFIILCYKVAQFFMGDETKN